MTVILHIIDWLLYAVLALPAFYFLAMAVASLFYREEETLGDAAERSFVLLIPAYRSDSCILETATAALSQDYPRERFRVLVISDGMKEETDRQLRTLGAEVLRVSFERSSKALALQAAMQYLGSSAAECVSILDADNIVDSGYLKGLDRAFASGCKALQAHRTAANRDSSTAVVDAASEEINNSIFRKGHVALGLSSALIGSGMAFDYSLFEELIAQCSSAGEDKELEALLLSRGVHIAYLDSTRVRDEKTREDAVYYRQRRRWIAAQFGSLGLAARLLARHGANIDLLDKIYQWCLPPRMLMMAGIALLALLESFICPARSLKWWIAALAVLLAMITALPAEQRDRKLLGAVLKAPKLVMLTLLNMFRLKGANKNFIHTSHGNSN